ncbi:FAD-binding domain-containing protein [Maricaulis sp. CAU 1757]
MKEAIRQAFPVPLAALAFIPTRRRCSRDEVMTFAASREAARARLQAVLPDLGRAYARDRNHDLGPRDRSNVSMLSPWIRHGVLAEREVVETVLQCHDRAAAEKFVQEVFWRSYFKGWLEHRPQVWDAYRCKLAEAYRDLQFDAQLRASHAAAIGGETGLDAFDYWVRELVETGYLHNHARMWFASIWIFTLKLPWVLGADFFMRHLLDGDPASNTCSWRWVAGLHTAGKHYLARADNIAKFTGGRFNLSGLLREDAAPIADTDAYEAQPLTWPDTRLPSDRYGLLLTSDSHEPHLSRQTAPSSILAVATATLRSPRAVSAAVCRFESDALEDRLAGYGAAARPLESIGDSAGFRAAVTRWAEAERIATVVLPLTTVGPVRDCLPPLAGELAARNIALVGVARNWDRQAWPHAGKGYFKLKARIPAILAALNGTAQDG